MENFHISADNDGLLEELREDVEEMGNFFPEDELTLKEKEHSAPMKAKAFLRIVEEHNKII
jgi:hypothetical protein